MLKFVLHIYFCYWVILTHRVTWLIDYVIMWYARRALSLLSLGQWSPILARIWLKLSWPQPSSQLAHLSSDHVIFAKRYISSFTRPMSSNLVGLWVRVKGHHLFLPVTCWSRDQVFFEKRHIFTNARPQNSAGDTEQRKTHKSKAFFIYSKYINIWFISICTTLKISALCGQVVYPIVFYYIYSGKE